MSTMTLTKEQSHLIGTRKPDENILEILYPLLVSLVTRLIQVESNFQVPEE